MYQKTTKKYCSDKVLNQIRKFASKHRLIECSYQIDAGSFMYVRDKIEKLIDSKILLKHKVEQFF